MPCCVFCQACEMQLKATYYFTSWALCMGRERNFFFFFYCLLETLQAAFFPFILSYKKHKVAITISQENKGLRR